MKKHDINITKQVFTGLISYLKLRLSARKWASLNNQLWQERPTITDVNFN